MVWADTGDAAGVERGSDARGVATSGRSKQSRSSEPRRVSAERAAIAGTATAVTGSNAVIRNPARDVNDTALHATTADSDHGSGSAASAGPVQSAPQQDALRLPEPVSAPRVDTVPVGLTVPGGVPSEVPPGGGSSQAPSAAAVGRTAAAPVFAVVPTEAPPVMSAAGPVAAATADAVPVGDLLTSVLPSVPESPLAWTVLGAARNQIGRTGRLRMSKNQPQSAPAASTPALPAHAPGEVLVAWKPGATANAKAQALGLLKATVIGKLGTQKMLQADQGVYRLKVPGGTAAAIAALSKNPAVAFVEPNYRVSATATSNDPSYTAGSLWGMSSDDSPTAYGPSGTTNQFGCGAEEAWGLGYTGSRDVVVAVLDEGIQITHPDLAANIWTNPGEIAGDGIDNDANGFADDVNGWDFYYDNSSVYDVGEDAHGTHVAGTIGAVGGNGTGVAGVCWNTRIIPTKFLGPQGGYISDAVDAMNYLVDMKSRYNIDLVAVNNSWGGGAYSSAMHGAILRAAKADILFVAAAGNATANNDTTATWPANYSTLQASATESAATYESVMSVASITSTGALSSFSNYGAQTVDLAAPGSGILSTVPTGTYASYNGTSMATPHVTGALALYASYNTTATAAQLRTAILNNAKPTTSLTGKTVTGGRLSLEGLFTAATPTPVATYDPALVSISAPGSIKAGRKTNVSITVGNRGNTGVQARVTLSATGGTVGGSTTVFIPAGGQSTVAISWTAPSSRGTHTLTALTVPAIVTVIDADSTNNSRTVSVKVQ